MIDPLTQKYLEVLNEGTDKGTVKTSFKTGDSFEGTKDLNKGNDPTENVDLDKPEEDKENSQDKKDGSLEKCKTSVKQESTELNPFESLYNKILSEDSFGWSMDDSENEDNTGEVEGLELSDDSGEDEEFDELGDEEGKEESSEGEVTITLDKETAEKLIDILQAAVGSEGTEEEGEEDLFGDEENDESEDEDEEDLFGSDEEDDEEDDEGELTKEEVDSEIVGHALVDQEKLLKGMNKPKNAVVKGVLSPKKKKAQVPSTGKGFKGELNKHKESAGKSLQGKNNKVSAVNVGKTLVDNK
jgi:hypothetical protein